MRILRVRHLFYPDMPKDYFYELSIRQANEGHEVNVVTRKTNSSFPEMIEQDGITIHRLAGFNLSISGMFTDFPYLPDLPKLVERLSPEVIHCESHLFLTAYQAVKVAKRLGIPCIVSVHGVSVKRNALLDSAQSVYIRTIGKWIFMNASGVICLTNDDSNEIVRMGCPKDKICIVPNAVDDTQFRPSESPPGKLIIWTGRFVNEKGLDCLLKAAKMISNRSGDAKFVLIGYGPLRQRLEIVSDKYGLLGKCLEFKGPFTREEIAVALRTASIFVLPSKKEGLPIALLEAMASGLAVVASKIPGVEEVVTDGIDGLLVAPGNPEAFALTILRLLNDDNLRSRLGRNARRTVQDRFNWNSVLGRLDSVYDDCS